MTSLRSSPFLQSKNGQSDNDNEESHREENALLEAKIQCLKEQIQAARQRRTQLEKSKTETISLQRKWMVRKNAALHAKIDACARLQSAVTRREAVEKQLDCSRRMHALNDCFHIWHRGPFGTINGLRLGSYVPPMPSEDTNGIESAGAGMEFDLSSTFGFGFFTENEGGNCGSQNYSHFRVPWSEINAALGFAALLLSTLEGNLDSGIKFTAYEIIPMGSFSKISTRVNGKKGTTGGGSSTVFNLYSDDSFQFFGKRNFNAALNGLLRCLADAGDSVVKRDRTMTLPHAIEENSRGELVIGGLVISHGSDGERWTRALKYMLTDLKWLVAFMAKHIDC